MTEGKKFSVTTDHGDGRDGRVGRIDFERTADGISINMNGPLRPDSILHLLPLGLAHIDPDLFMGSLRAARGEKPA
jgi:hypothetical protein